MIPFARPDFVPVAVDAVTSGTDLVRRGLPRGGVEACWKIWDTHAGGVLKKAALEVARGGCSRLLPGGESGTGVILKVEEVGHGVENRGALKGRSGGLSTQSLGAPNSAAGHSGRSWIPLR